MAGLLKNNALLLAVAAAAVLVFTTMTLPAIERNKQLREKELQMSRKLEVLRQESLRLQQQLSAIDNKDPALLERAVRSRFQLGAAIGEGADER